MAFEIQTQKVSERWPFEYRMVRYSDAYCIHMSHVGSILQITSFRINLFKVCLRINSNKKDHWQSCQNDSRQNKHLQLIQANSNMPLFRGQLLHYVDTSKTSILEDKLHGYVLAFSSYRAPTVRKFFFILGSRKSKAFCSCNLQKKLLPQILI
jgi:hypothetical protein